MSLYGNNVLIDSWYYSAAHKVYLTFSLSHIQHVKSTGVNFLSIIIVRAKNRRNSIIQYSNSRIKFSLRYEFGSGYEKPINCI